MPRTRTNQFLCFFSSFYLPGIKKDRETSVISLFTFFVTARAKMILRTAFAPRQMEFFTNYSIYF